mmetsp:Transcript_23490/g.68649  ORF Transcript_23490/g.68649 Transcript_23490/m.68649 type:complete len:380 (-) Transcript_23490:783-1922(-)
MRVLHLTLLFPKRTPCSTCGTRKSQQSSLCSSVTANARRTLFCVDSVSLCSTFTATWHCKRFPLEKVEAVPMVWARPSQTWAPPTIFSSSTTRTDLQPKPLPRCTTSIARTFPWTGLRLATPRALWQRSSSPTTFVSTGGGAMRRTRVTLCSRCRRRSSALASSCGARSCALTRRRRSTKCSTATVPTTATRSQTERNTFTLPRTRGRENSCTTSSFSSRSTPQISVLTSSTTTPASCPSPSSPSPRLKSCASSTTSTVYPMKTTTLAPLLSVGPSHGTFRPLPISQSARTKCDRSGASSATNSCTRESGTLCSTSWSNSSWGYQSTWCTVPYVLPSSMNLGSYAARLAMSRLPAASTHSLAPLGESTVFLASTSPSWS